MAELEETLGHDEWVRWVAFHALYDLPDGFLVAGQLGALVSRAAWGRGAAGEFAPYFAAGPDGAAAGNGSLRGAFAFLKTNAPDKRRKPI